MHVHVANVLELASNVAPDAAFTKMAPPVAEGAEHFVKVADVSSVSESVALRVAERAAPAPLVRVRRAKVQLAREALPQSPVPPLILTAGEESETEFVECDDAMDTKASLRKPLRIWKRGTVMGVAVLREKEIDVKMTVGFVLDVPQDALF